MVQCINLGRQLLTVTLGKPLRPFPLSFSLEVFPLCNALFFSQLEKAHSSICHARLSKMWGMRAFALVGKRQQSHCPGGLRAWLPADDFLRYPKLSGWPLTRSKEDRTILKFLIHTMPSYTRKIIHKKNPNNVHFALHENNIDTYAHCPQNGLNLA